MTAYPYTGHLVQLHLLFSALTPRVYSGLKMLLAAVFRDSGMVKVEVDY